MRLITIELGHESADGAYRHAVQNLTYSSPRQRSCGRSDLVAEARGADFTTGHVGESSRPRYTAPRASRVPAGRLGSRAPPLSPGAQPPTAAPKGSVRGRARIVRAAGAPIRLNLARAARPDQQKLSQGRRHIVSEAQTSWRSDAPRTVRVFPSLPWTPTPSKHGKRHLGLQPSQSKR